MNGTEQEEQKKKGIQPVAVIVVVLAVVVVLIVIMSKKQSFKAVQAGLPAHEFTLPDLDGKNVNLSDFRGKVVFLNFWATWCKPCEDEMPSMQALYSQLTAQGKPFVILAVSLDDGGPEKIKEFAAKYNITFPIVQDKSGKVKELYKTTGVPETFIIDQNGVIAEKIWGPRDWSNRAYLTTIIKLLSDGPQPPESYHR